MKTVISLSHFKKENSKNKFVYQITLTYLLGVFILLPIARLFINFDESAYHILITGIWGAFYWLASYESLVFYFNKIHTYIALFLLYIFIHFIKLSPAKVYEIEFWRIFSFFFLYYSFSTITEPQKLKKTVIYIILARFLIELPLGILQYFNVIKATLSDSFNVVGTLTSTNHYSFLLSIGIVIIGLNYFLKPKQLTVIKMLWIVLAVVALTLIIYLKSRTAILGLIVFLIFLVVTKTTLVKKLKTLNLGTKLAISALAVILVFGGSYFLYQLKKDSAQGRLFTAKITTQEIFKKPLLGHGLTSFESGYNAAKSNYFLTKQRDWEEIKIADHISHAFNDFLQTAYELGLVGLGGVIFILIVCIKNTSFSNKKSIIGLSIVAFLIIASMFASLVANSTFAWLLLFGSLLINVNPKTPINIKSNMLYKRFFLFLSFTLLAHGTTRIYARHRINILKEQKNNSTAKKLSDWFPFIEDQGHNAYYHGLILFHRLNKKSKGLRLMHMGVNRNKNFDDIRNLALYYAHTGNLKEAEKLMRFNVGNRPYLLKSRLDLAILQDKLQNKKQACKTLQYLIKLPIKIPSKTADSIKNEAQLLLNKVIKNKSH